MKRRLELAYRRQSLAGSEASRNSHSSPLACIQRGATGCPSPSMSISSPGPDHDRPEAVHVGRHPLLLLGAPDGDKKHVDARRSDRLDDAAVLRLGERTKRRRVRVGDGESREPRGDPSRSGGEDVVRRPIQAEPEPSLLGLRAHGEGEILPAHVVRVGEPPRPQRPVERPAVRDHEVGRIHDTAERRVVDRFHGHVDVGGEHHPGRVTRCPVADEVGRFAARDPVDAHSQDPPA